MKDKGLGESKFWTLLDSFWASTDPRGTPEASAGTLGQTATPSPRRPTRSIVLLVSYMFYHIIFVEGSPEPRTLFRCPRNRVGRPRLEQRAQDAADGHRAGSRALHYFLLPRQANALRSPQIRCLVHRRRGCRSGHRSSNRSTTTEGRSRRGHNRTRNAHRRAKG